VRHLAYRSQRTIATPAVVRGIGAIAGQPITLRFCPAPADAGVCFVRVDQPGQPVIPATASTVSDTRRRTTLGRGPGSVTLVEHVLSALAGLRIDNCRIELDGSEPPGLDGSAAAFVNALHEARIVAQPVRRSIVTVVSPMAVARDGATITVFPATEPGLRVSYLLDYGLNSPIPRQSVTLDVSPESYTRELASCRTFLLESEAELLRRNGIGLHLTSADLLVFGSGGVIGNPLHCADEPARHKILDLIGDLSLSGCELAGHVVAYRSGHCTNVELASRLAANFRTMVGNDESDRPATLPFRRPAITRRAA
jgi:UDP-3-O-acyl N-acetylglucosamine deacetylase